MQDVYGENCIPHLNKIGLSWKKMPTRTYMHIEAKKKSLFTFTLTVTDGWTHDQIDL